ncbi:hypothetical protein JTE90_021082 [Oedothorax gibbosus]|uniref:DUF19 domain-containing protein n=1 Tax=Oedothorax gibbosus TaxID=931172 RepID=A0AAV6VQS0_9ARAC|nr:hypothetical protein JTE90_021082 [Oedothorax gibbosus]
MKPNNDSVFASATEDGVCDPKQPELCISPSVHADFPGSEEELDKICPVFIPRFKCLSDFKKRCNDVEYPRQFKGFENVHDSLVEACDKDSELHKKLAINLPCIKEIIANHLNTCTPIVKEAIAGISNHPDIEFNVDNISDDNDWSKYVCLHETLDIACFVASSSVRCGEEAGEMVGAVLDQIGIMKVLCPEDIREEVLAVVAIVQPSVELGVVAEEVLSKIK